MPGEGALPSFRRMYELWQDLEVWSTQDKQGEVGLFEVTFAGEMMHVGLPKAQALLTEEERHALPLIFAEASLDPAMSPPAAQIARAMRQRGDGRLVRRTMARVKKPQDDRELFDVLLDVVVAELAGWDGSVPIEKGGTTRQVRGLVVLTLKVEKLAGTSATGMRCRVVRRPFPETGLELKGDSVSAVAREEVPGWSSVLALTDGAELDASGLDWRHGLTLRDDRVNWSFGLPASEARVFVSGRDFGLSHLVENGHLPERREFYLAFADRAWPDLADWVESSCAGFQEVPAASGLPDGWRLARCQSAKTSAPGNRFPALALPDMLRLRLRGGVRSSPGRNEYFIFALPDVSVEGADPSLSPDVQWGPAQESGT